jgi:enoyl-CoA hydratase/carnithine racemase
MPDDVRYETEDQIAQITVNRPEKMNAMTDAMYAQIGDAIRQADADPAVRCLIITGEGRAFSAGHDLLEFGERGAGWQPWSPDRFDVGLECSKPTIAAINGYSLAGGLELALFCDIRIASNDAQFGCPEVKWAILHGYGALRLPGMIGMSDALWMLFSGDFIDAERALRIGLVSEVTSPDELLPTARALAQRIAANGPMAVRLTKELAVRSRDLSLGDGLRLYQEYSRLAFSSDDAREGIASFAEKRDPTYQDS